MDDNELLLRENERDCNDCGRVLCTQCGGCACNRFSCRDCRRSEDEATKLAVLRHARALFHNALRTRDRMDLRVWGQYRWAVLADLYQARGNLPGVARCVAHLGEA